jgi:membrane associated rhomboid family serine protease
LNHLEYWSLVSSHKKQAKAQEECLVLTAVGIENELRQDAGYWLVMVKQDQIDAAKAQIKDFHFENIPSMEKAIDPILIDNGWFGVLGFLAVIWLMPTLEALSSAQLALIGSLTHEGIVNGQWWRAITALTLHGDIAHIMANSFFGSLFGLFVGRHMGSGFGWLVVVIGAAIANIMNALLMGLEFRSIGSSTACFVALGLIPAFSWRNGYFKGSGWKKGFAPIFGAIAMFAFTGVSDQPNTDVSAHILGFLCGLIIGLLIPKSRVERLTLKDQQRAGTFTLLLILSSWLAAIP